MVTVVNSPGPGSVERTDSSAGWAVAVMILFAVLIVGGLLWMRYYRAPAAAPAGGADINVTLPDVTPGGGEAPGGGAPGGGTPPAGGTGGGAPGGGTVPAPAP